MFAVGHTHQKHLDLSFLCYLPSHMQTRIKTLKINFFKFSTAISKHMMTILAETRATVM
jgi:hypothetical protein